MASTACKQPQAATLHVGDRGDSPADGMRRGAAPRAWHPAARRLEALEPGAVGAHGARAREPARAQQRRGAQAKRVVRLAGRPVHLVVRAPARGSGCVSSAPPQWLFYFALPTWALRDAGAWHRAGACAGSARPCVFRKGALRTTTVAAPHARAAARTWRRGRPRLFPGSAKLLTS